MFNLLKSKASIISGMLQFRASFAVLAAVFFALTVVSSAAAAAPAGNWNLIWSDEFDGTSIDTNTWGYGQLPWGGNHHNDQYSSWVTPEDSYLENGSLILRCRKAVGDEFGGYPWSEGFVWSNQWDTYGYQEIRARYPLGKGVWPAFWTLMSGWPPEFDIAEYFGSDDRMHMGFCWGPDWTDTHWDSTNLYNEGFENWHVYALEWGPGYAKWYMDGVVRKTLCSSEIPSTAMYILLNSGMRWDYDSSTPNPNYYEVDYFRWYQEDTQPTLVDDTDASIAYSGTWGEWSGNPSYNGTEHYSSTTDSTATFTFTGTRARYYGALRNDLGYADILLDGQQVDSIDCYHATGQYFMLLYESPYLSYGEHTLGVKVNGTKNANSSGTEIIVDAFGYYTEGGEPDTTPPSPDPMTWAVVPYATGSSSIAMEATTATDPSGVEYYFTCTAGGGHDSGWQSSTSYEDTGLSPSTQYTYTVTARDKSANQNSTAASTAESATTDAEDLTAPSPDPMTWAVVPYATGSSSIAMEATTASDPSGVEYYFACTSGGGNDSGWQDSTSYEDTGLTPDTTYTYTVKARDKSPNQNQTAVSTAESATTDPFSGVDDTANSDIPVSGSVGGTYADTQASDDVCESITERESGGRPQNRYSYLEHKWTINVTGGTGVTFYVEAYQSSSSDGDNFVFAYSTDDSSYTDMLTVSKTADDDSYQSYVLPASLSGTVYIRVVDTDRTSGNRGLDTIYVDHMYIHSAGGEPDTTPPSPDPMTWATLPYATGSTSIAMVATTATDESGVEYYFSCTSGGGHDSGWQDSSSYEDTGLSAETTYTYAVTARDKSANQNQTAASTAESATTDPAGVEPDMYVNDIAMSYRNAGPNYWGRATVWVKDDTGANVEGATVYCEWSGAVSETTSGITGSDGKVLIETSDKVKNGGTFNFCVTNVTKSGYVYNSGLNVETCDSITAP